MSDTKKIDAWDLKPGMTLKTGEHGDLVITKVDRSHNAAKTITIIGTVLMSGGRPQERYVTWPRFGVANVIA